MYAVIHTRGKNFRRNGRWIFMDEIVKYLIVLVSEILNYSLTQKYNIIIRKETRWIILENLDFIIV